jgi:23S rRNA (adenine2503-C2)-methyltransferase
VEEHERKAVLALKDSELAEAVERAGCKPYHGGIVRRWILERGVDDFTKMSDLPKHAAERLARMLRPVSATVAARTTASDGTVKLLLKLDDANTVETVWMPGERLATVCISTQVGCPVACQFCASGLAGLVRNLEPHEIVEQVVRARQCGPIGRIVVMGIGEPMLNLKNVIAALDTITGERGMALSARKVTISTVGYPARIAELAKVGRPWQLAISLHASNDTLRRQLIPTAGKTTIADLLQAAADYFKATGREVTFEYVLLHGVNDRPHDARELARALRGARGMVNLIPYNPIPGSRFARPPAEAVSQFRDALKRAGVVATVRWSRGVETDAACGQLRIGSSAPG